MLQGTGGSTEAERLVALVSAKSRTIESLTQKCGDQASDNQALMEQMQTMHREFQTVKLDLNAQMQVAQSQAQMYGRQLEESQEQRNTAEQARTHSEDSSQREVAKLLALNTELKQADGMRADQERNFKLVSEKMTSTAKVKDEVVQLMQRKVASCEEESQRLHSLLERGKDETRALESSMKDKERQATSLLEKQQVLERELSVQERSKALLIHECDTLKEADMDAQMRIFELESMVAELSTNLASKQQHLQGLETHALHRQEHQNTIQAMLEGSAMNEQITKLEAQTVAQSSLLTAALKEVSDIKAKADDYDNVNRSLAAVKYRLESKQQELAHANQRFSEINEEYEKKAEHCRFLGDKIRDLSGAVPNNKYIHKLESDIRKASQQESRLLKQIEQQSSVVPSKQSSKKDEIEFMKKEISNLKREHQREIKLLKMRHQDELRSGDQPVSSKQLLDTRHSVSAMVVRSGTNKSTPTRPPLQLIN